MYFALQCFSDSVLIHNAPASLNPSRELALNKEEQEAFGKNVENCFNVVRTTLDRTAGNIFETDTLVRADGRQQVVVRKYR